MLERRQTSVDKQHCGWRRWICVVELRPFVKAGLCVCQDLQPVDEVQCRLPGLRAYLLILRARSCSTCGLFALCSGIAASLSPVTRRDHAHLQDQHSCVHIQRTTSADRLQRNAISSSGYLVSSLFGHVTTSCSKSTLTRDDIITLCLHSSAASRRPVRLLVSSCPSCHPWLPPRPCGLLPADLSLGAEPVYRLNRWGLAGPASTLMSLKAFVRLSLIMW